MLEKRYRHHRHSTWHVMVTFDPSPPLEEPRTPTIDPLPKRFSQELHRAAPGCRRLSDNFSPPNRMSGSTFLVLPTVHLLAILPNRASALQAPKSGVLHWCTYSSKYSQKARSKNPGHPSLLYACMRVSCVCLAGSAV